MLKLFEENKVACILDSYFIQAITENKRIEEAVNRLSKPANTLYEEEKINLAELDALEESLCHYGTLAIAIVATCPYIKLEIPNDDIVTNMHNLTNIEGVSYEK